MNNTPRQLFPTWYRRVNLACDEKTIEKRLHSLNRIVSLEELELWINIVKIYLGQAIPQDDTSNFIEYFLKEDSFFPIEDNEHTLRLLAGTALCIQFTEYSSSATYFTALAIITSAFLDQHSLRDLPPVYKYATEALKMSSSTLRKPKNVNIGILNLMSGKLKKMTNPDEEENEIDTDENVKEVANVTITLLDIVKQMNDWNKSVSEELNSLWWLYGEVSGAGKQRFDKLGTSKMIVFGALDLFEITHEVVGLLKAKDFLGKALLASSKKAAKDEFSVYDVVNLLNIEEKKMFDEYFNEPNKILTPILAAFNFSQQIDAGEDWEPLFRKKFPGTDVKKHLMPLI